MTTPRGSIQCRSTPSPFRGKIDPMEEHIRTFELVAGTLTQVLLDSWYGTKSVWKAARERGFLITTGIKRNRALRVPDPGVGLALAATLGVCRRAHGGRFYAAEME